ncbi:hypothetical protein [Niallia sp. 03133]|uniref:hypothetical protein n=1 Tax=Niallia sp. 03133 TaxID=3458060 RepID=UPI004043EABE
MNKTEKKYRLFLVTQSCSNKDRDLIIDSLETGLFCCEVSLQPFFTLRTNVHKMLLFIDELAILERLALIDFLSKRKIDKELYVKTEKISLSIIFFNQFTLLPMGFSSTEYQILSQQYIGTNLFIAGNWETVKQLKKLAYEVGYEDDEIQYSEYGKKGKCILR